MGNFKRINEVRVKFAKKSLEIEQRGFSVNSNVFEEYEGPGIGGYSSYFAFKSLGERTDARNSESSTTESLMLVCDILNYSFPVRIDGKRISMYRVLDYGPNSKVDIDNPFLPLEYNLDDDVTSVMIKIIDKGEEIDAVSQQAEGKGVSLISEDEEEKGEVRTFAHPHSQIEKCSRSKLRPCGRKVYASSNPREPLVFTFDSGECVDPFLTEVNVIQLKDYYFIPLVMPNQVVVHWMVHKESPDSSGKRDYVKSLYNGKSRGEYKYDIDEMLSIGQEIRYIDEIDFFVVQDVLACIEFGEEEE